MPRRLTLPLATSAVLAAIFALGATAALAGTVARKDDPGITSRSILIGGTAPLTGLGAASAGVAKGAEAYFRWVNARGGVNGRTITYKVLDDRSDPNQSLLLTRQLVEQDKVFALFGAVGTAAGLATRPYLNTAKVPQLFVASGGTTFGRDYAQYPYTSGFQPSYQSEGWVYGKYLARTASGSAIAVLFQDDELGRELLVGLKRGLQRSKTRVIAALPYDPTASDVTAQMTRLKASGADSLAVFASSPIAAQAYELAHKLGWKPKHIVLDSAAATPATMTTASEGGKNGLVAGTISVAFLKDPGDPQWSKDRGIALLRRIVTKYAPGSSATDPMVVYGMAAAWTLVEAIRRVGKDLSRDKLVKLLDGFTATGNPFLLPGIVVKMSGADHFPVEQMLLQRWQTGSWRSFGGLWAYRTG